MLVVTTTTNGRLEARWFSGANNGDDVADGSSDYTLLDLQSATDSPSIALHDGQIWLANLAPDRTVRLRRFEGAGWSAAANALDASGVAIVASPNGSPSLASTKVPTPNGTTIDDFTEGLYLAVPRTASNTLNLFLRDEGNGRYGSVSPWENSAPTNIMGRVSMEHVPGGSGRAARTYFHFRTDNPAAGRVGDAMRMLSFVRTTSSGPRHVLGLTGDLHNVWLDVWGIDTLFRPGVDTSLRLVLATPIGSNKLEFRPIADGIVDHELLPWNDFEVLGIDLCATTQIGSPSHVNCHPWKWATTDYGGVVKAVENPHFCVHKQSPGFGNGNILHIWKCSSGGSGDKNWRYEHKTGYIHAAGDMSMCWHKQRSDWQEGQTIHLWKCDQGFDEQKSWILDPVSQTIRSKVRPDLCIAKETAVWQDGVDLKLRSCPGAGDPNNRFTF